MNCIVIVLYCSGITFLEVIIRRGICATIWCLKQTKIDKRLTKNASLERVSYDRERYTDYLRVGSRIDKNCNLCFFFYHL